MSDILYLFGILYIIFHIKNIYDSVTYIEEDVDKYMDEVMPDGMTRNDMIKKASEDLIKSIPSTLWSLFTWIWIIFGVSYSEESILFLGILLILILNILQPIMKAIIHVYIKRDESLPSEDIFIDCKEESKRVLKSQKIKNTNKTKIWILESIIKICLTIVILYHHFFIK